MDGSRCRIKNSGGTCSCEVGFIGERWIIDDHGTVIAQYGFRRDASRRPFAAILNPAYFGVEFAVAMAIGSVSLFADSIDFLEDTLRSTF